MPSTWPMPWELRCPRSASFPRLKWLTPKFLQPSKRLHYARWPTGARSRERILDGPLAFDNAISAQAAKTKGISSPVSGDVDILLAPDLEAANMLFKQLTYLAGAEGAGIVLGTRIPIVLTSRADSVRTRLASAAVMAQVANARRRGKFDTK